MTHAISIPKLGLTMEEAILSSGGSPTANA